MGGQLLRLSLLFMSVTCSSSIDATVGDETSKAEYLPNFPTNGPLFAELNNNTTSDKVASLNEKSTDGLAMSLASTKESDVTAGQEASPAGGETAGKTSTLTADMTNMSTTAITPRPDNGLTTHSIDLSNTSHEDKTNDHNVTFYSHTTSKTMGTSKPGTTPNPKDTSRNKQKEDNDRKKLILIVVCIVIVILILVSVLIIMMRGKRRRGSQSFSTRNRSSNRQDVWAGQVPELGDGKMTPHPVAMENGKAGNKAEPGSEQEMITFIGSEKKDDSMVEVNELDKGETLDEKKPLLEETSQVSEEAAKSPGEEEIPATTMEQQLV